MLSVLCTVVVEGLVVSADFSVDFVHIFNYNLGNSVVVLVTSFSCLEEDIVVLSSTSCYGVFGVERTAAELFNSVPVEHISKVCIIPLFNLLNFVRSSEAVKEVEERNSALDSCKVSNCCKVHTFLRVV